MFSGEIVKSKLLKWALGALAFNYFIIFYDWIRRSVITVEAAQSYHFNCPTFFQQCDALYVLQKLPYGYSQTFLYMLLFAVLVWVVYLMSEQRWREAQWVLLIPFVWHTLNTFVLSWVDSSGNYEYYVVGYGLILLLFPHKEFFLKLFIVMLYVLSTTVKIHPAWVEGAYFTNLQNGLPIFPEWSIPIFSNVVILMEMVGAWFLMSRHRNVQRAVLVFFILFHLYSGILVEYRYPATVFLMALIVFGPWYQYTKPPLDRKSLFGWSFIILFVGMQFIPKFVTGDEKLTMEGGKFGVYMFESNHQCISEANIHYTDGAQRTVLQVRAESNHRCTPYYYWLNLHARCSRNPEIDRITWTLDHSINGRPFLRIVDTENVCDLTYKPFSHNEWIKTEADDPEVVGWPVKNYYGHYTIW